MRTPGRSPPPAAASCRLPPPEVQPSGLSTQLRCSPLIQVLLLRIKLEEMENVESVSLPTDANYTMTVRHRQPGWLCVHSAGSAPRLLLAAGSHACIAAAAHSFYCCTASVPPCA